LPFDLERAMANGLTREQSAEVVTHLACDAGRSNAICALQVVMDVFAGGRTSVRAPSSNMCGPQDRADEEAVQIPLTVTASRTVPVCADARTRSTRQPFQQSDHDGQASLACAVAGKMSREGHGETLGS
jgi:hypothetical protein